MHCRSRILLSALGTSALLALTGRATLTHAGEGLWTSNGPFGGTVRALVADPVASGTIYAAGDGGVFKSVDGASTWKPARDGITELSIVTVAVDPTNNQIVYAGSNAGGGVFKSTDGGATWSQRINGLAITTIKSLAVDPQHPATIYAGTDCCGIYSSSDGAASWTWLNGGGLPPASVSAIAIDPIATSTVYAGLQSNGVYKSTDGGAHWSPASDGLGINNLLYALVIDRTTPGALYVGTASAIYRSTDGATHWTPINGNLLNPQLQSLAVDPQAAGTLYVGTLFDGVFRTVDGGTTWSAINNGVVDKGIRALGVDGQVSSNVYGGTETGVLKTNSNGTLWAAANNGLSNTAIQAVAVDPLHPATVYAGVRRNGVFKSVDGGATWSASSTGLSALNGSNDVLSFAIDPVMSSTIYAGTGKGVYKSVNGGASWTISSSGLGTPRVLTLAIDPDVPLTLHAGTNGFGMYTSTDGGATWFPDSAGLPDHTVVYALSVAGDTILVVDPIKGPYFSVGLPTSFFLDTPDPDNEFYSGVYLTGLSAKRGAAQGDGPAEPSRMVGVAYVASKRVDVYLGYSGSKTRNDAATYAAWQLWGSTLGVEARLCAPIHFLVGDPVTYTTFYGGADCGVLKGTNAGQQVVAMNEGLPPNLQVNALAITPSSSVLYAGTTGGGVYGYGLATQRNYEGLWWNDPPGSESGWGINLAHQGDVIFATWFTYDSSGKPWWLGVSATRIGPNVFRGDLFTTTGPAFDAVPFNPGQVVETTVGTATLTFTDNDHGTFAYTVNVDPALKSLVAQTKSITRQQFGTLPACAWGKVQDLSVATNYQDVWWKAPAASESGWGINFTHQDDTIFATWFTYDLAGKPWWLGLVADRAVPGVYAGDVFTTTGPPFNAVPFDPATVVETPVGTGTLTFANGNAGTFSYTVNGVTQSKALTRQVFTPPGTLCTP